MRRRLWASAALLALSGLASAHAEMPAAAHSLRPTAISATVPALGASAVRPAPGHSLSVRPAAVEPNAARDGSVSCGAAAALTRFDHPLLRTARRLAGRKPLVVVAVGSSSTAGAGASSPAANYPSRLAAELKKLFPGRAIVVLNRGVNGEEVPQMLLRFRTGVIAAHPQLVLWQLGTNSVLRGRPLEPHSAELREGINELRASGADVVLIDPQYAPKVLARPQTPAMVEQIALAAKDDNVNLFHRFAVMRGWYEAQHRSFTGFVSPDGLHMNDWGYACWAKLIARAIAAAATPPVASVSGHAAP